MKLAENVLIQKFYEIKGFKLTLQNVPGVLNGLIFGFPNMIYMIHDGNIE